MFFAMKTCEYYLRGKKFTYEGDHANLQWIERSTEGKVIRQRLYMQSFGFDFNHIPGYQNGVSDWQSRFEALFEDEYLAEDESSYNSSEELWNVCSDVSPEPILEESLSEIVSERYRTRSSTNVVPNVSPTVVRNVPENVTLDNVEPNVASKRPVTRSKIASSSRLPGRRLGSKRLTSSDPSTTSDSPTTLKLTRRDMLHAAHQSRAGHLGIKRTYDKLNILFPGHGISVSQVTEYKELCPICQKTEDYMSSRLVPIVRHLKTVNPGKVVGLDFLSVNLDKYGNAGAYVFRDHFTKFVYILPAASHDASLAALAIFSYCVLYGACDVLMTDPGSDLTSKAVAQVNVWFGIHHRLSLVDRHESNGVEGANKQILRHLGKLFMTERIKDEWSSPQHVGWAMYLMNRYDVSESGFSPYDLTFGTVTNRRFDFASGKLDSTETHKYVTMLNDSLKSLSSAAARYQDDLVAKRTSVNQLQNVYQKGDLVLFRLNRTKHKPHKLHPIYLGPYEVLDQTKNDVQVRHLALHTISTLYVGDLKVFYGSREDARQLASIDADQFLVSRISAYRGDPLQRSTMYFFVEYADSDKLWIPWSLDLQNAEAYHTFCASRPELAPLLLSSNQLTTWLRKLRSEPIKRVSANQQLLVDIRSFGSDWYSTLTLPDKDTLTYLAPVTFTEFAPNKKTVLLTCPLLRFEQPVDNVYITMYVHPHVTSGPHHVIDDALVSEHPSLHVSRKAAELSASDFEYLVGRSFYDNDARSTFEVTRIAVTRTRDIVAYVKPQRTDGRPAREDKQPYHVADVISMVPADRT